MPQRRIAVIADIHGNIPALEAVLDDLAHRQVDEVLVGGDLVGRGPQGGAVVRRIRALGLATIGGNHEEYLLAFRRREVPEAWWHGEEWAASRWMAAELAADEADFIAELPFSTSRGSLRLVHGTPSTNRDGIGPWTRDDDVDAHLDSVDESLLVCAHTHRPLERTTDRGMVVNVGSVGLPFNRDSRAQYAIFQGDPDDERARWQTEFRQVEYDLDAVYAVYEQTGFLAEGGIVARLLRLELEHAAPMLVPFLEWAAATGVPPSIDQLDAFLDVRRLDRPLRDFFLRLKARKAASEPSSSDEH